MSQIVGYGISVRNTPIEEHKTVADQELIYLGFHMESYIDIVRSDTSKRPMLDYLIQTLEKGDIIFLYSINALTLGNKNRALKYYTAILEKGIELMIFDFSGAVARTSPFSTLRYKKDNNNQYIRVPKSNTELISDFEVYLKYATPQKSTGKRKTELRFYLPTSFKIIYFAYESYQIDLPTALELTTEYCDIRNKATFWLAAKDYETSLNYCEELNLQPKEILDLPKRCGGVPSEYYEIVNHINSFIVSDKTEKELCETAMYDLNMISNYAVFQRWQKLANNAVKPRKPKTINFDRNKFRENSSDYYDDRELSWLFR